MNKTALKSMTLLFAFAALAFVAAQAVMLDNGASATTVPVVAETTKAVAVLHPTEGNNVKGVVTFAKVDGKVKIVAHIEGLTPGKHGFHIHEWGDCSSKDGAAAGGHYNPANHPHGAPGDAKRHSGDLGNLEAGADGKAHLEVSDSVLQLDGAASIIGRGVIVHANADDLKTQPTGNAGGRQACGVIGVGKP